MENQISELSPQPRTSRIWLSIIISVLTTALIVGVAVYAWQQSVAADQRASLQDQLTNMQQQIQDLKESPSPVLQNASPAPATYSDFGNVYLNNRYGYKITLPTNWVAREVPVAGGLDGSSPAPSLYDGQTSTVIFFSSPQATTSSEFDFSIGDDAGHGKHPLVTLNGKQWTRIDRGEEIWYAIHVPFSRDISYQFETTKDKETLLKQVLSTFEFIK